MINKSTERKINLINEFLQKHFSPLKDNKVLFISLVVRRKWLNASEEEKVDILRSTTYMINKMYIHGPVNKWKYQLYQLFSPIIFDKHIIRNGNELSIAQLYSEHPEAFSVMMIPSKINLKHVVKKQYKNMTDVILKDNFERSVNLYGILFYDPISIGQQVKVENPYVIVDIDEPKVEHPIQKIVEVCRDDYLLNILHKCIKTNKGFIINTPSGGIHMVVYGNKCLEHVYKNREQLSTILITITQAKAVEFLSKGNLIHLPFNDNIKYY